MVSKSNGGLIMAENKEFKFPTETIDLPSSGKLYDKNSPLSSGKIDIKYMTAKEEDILTSQNLIKKGTVIDKLLDSLIVTEGVKVEDLVLGDKNAIMVASRILAYGPEYEAEITNPITGEIMRYIFNLADCDFKEISSDINENNFKVKLPISKVEVTYKVLTGKEEKIIENELNSIKKLKKEISPELTTRLRHIITSIDGNTEQSNINNFVDNMLSKDSLYLRQEIAKNSPDIDLSQEIEIEGETVRVDIPMTVNFFWPNAGT
jgi:hypothetical protein